MILLFRYALTTMALLASTGNYASEYPLTRANSNLSEKDLWVLSQTLGVQFERMQFEAEEDFCVQVWLEVTRRATSQEQDRGGHCSFAGLQYFYVVWRLIEAELVEIATALHDGHTASRMVGGEPTKVTGLGSSTSTFDPWLTEDGQRKSPVLKQGDRVRVADFAFGRRDEEVRFRVYLQLHENPRGRIGTGAIDR